MITCHHLKNTMLFSLFVIVFSVAMISCGDSKQNSTSQSQDLNQTTNPPTTENDSRFMVHAAEFHFEQILLGKLARQRATAEEIRELATLIEEEHRAAKSSLGSMGIIKSIAVPSIPAKDAHDAYDKLNEVPVEDFDAAYLSQVIQGHQEIIRHYEKCASAQHDPDILMLAAKQLPELQMHLSMAMELDAQSAPLSEVIR